MHFWCNYMSTANYRNPPVSYHMLGYPDTFVGAKGPNCDIGDPMPVIAYPRHNREVQPAAWSWADGGDPDIADLDAACPDVRRAKHIFGINNLNKGGPYDTMDNWIYRSNPIDGTCAVIDEFKIYPSGGAQSVWARK